MSFRPGDRVRFPAGRTGTVLSEPKQYDRARGDRFSGPGVEVRLDPMYGSSVVVDQTHLLTHLDGPEVVVLVEFIDEVALKRMLSEDSLREAESVNSAARRLEKQIMRVVGRAAALDPAFCTIGSRVTVEQAEQVLEAHGEQTWIPPRLLEKLRGMRVNILVEEPAQPE